MRLISVLIALAIVAYILSRVLTPAADSKEVTTSAASQNAAAPRVPTSPGNLNKFETDVNQFVEDANAEQRRRLDEIEESSDK